MARYQDDCDPLDEKAPPGRDRKGRFRKGSSGNPRGKKKVQFKRDPGLPASRRRVISEVADKQIEVTIDGQKRSMSLFEANVHAIAVAGAKGNRIAAQKFIDLMLELADRDLKRRVVAHTMMENINAIAEENELLKTQVGHQGGAIVLGSEKFDEWDAERRIDDEKGVAEVFSGDRLGR